jgi:hypothetical protein
MFKARSANGLDAASVSRKVGDTVLILSPTL